MYIPPTYSLPFPPCGSSGSRCLSRLSQLSRGVPRGVRAWWDSASRWAVGDASDKRSVGVAGLGSGFGGGEAGGAELAQGGGLVAFGEAAAGAVGQQGVVRVVWGGPAH